jgi:DNA-binding GntR family transcriptional regulator
VPTPPALQTLKLESTPAMVAERIRTGILDGTFAPGAQLAEVDLAAQLGVSRGPVREALQRLIHEGLARAERNRGVFVVSLDASDARDVYYVRELVEQAAGSALASRRDPAVIAELTATIDDMEAMTDAPWSALVDIDLAFHRIVVRSARSPRLDRIYATLEAETRLCLLHLERFYPDRAELVAEHRQLIAAVAAGDQPALDALLHEHLAAALARIERDSDDEAVGA